MGRRHFFGTILVGNSSLLKEGVAGILRSANFRIVASVPSADDFQSGKVKSRQLLFITIHTGEDFDLAKQIEHLRARNPGARFAVLTDRYRLEELVSAFRAGASGYFVDVMTCEVFTKSLELVMMGETVLPSAFLPFVLGPEIAPAEQAGPNSADGALLAATEDIAPQLSPREKSILRCLIDGDSNKCIARKIDIAEATVKVHVKAILRKIRVHNRTQAAIWGMNNGWLARTSGNGHRK